MIYIDISKYTPSSEWLDIADGLTTQLLKLTDSDDINKFIDDKKHQKHWSILKATLPYSEKCWISEAKEVSPRTIEHFRPKKMVCRTSVTKKEFPTFNEAQRKDWTKATNYKGRGYWWLTFDYKNFRVCLSDINSKKSNRFPLKLGSSIAYTNTDNHNSEIFFLLDPTKKGDANLITFEPDGKVKPSETDVSKDEFIRADVSIKIYGLNDIKPLVDHRNTKWKDCYELIKDNQYFYPLIKAVLEESADIDDSLIDPLERFHSKCKQLQDLISPKSEYSAVAKTCLQSYANSYTWIKDYVLPS